ncbi:hypothetical protein PPL_10766 [Heterostelium album PN500]|uniref:RNA polymerase II subunit B1 CTD phosphatase RPAP2 homolog n=1 Tax=Heterostelium pallidum (strain ATCC 26659 / Pp 5 / PN500) TaxID=670386 RepID=D3BRX6_HETP5|nr:hypothetical protein PPL_10766 [Heterostelium album PN500]EFA75713.1 hypothetical protein PPL_10766 [Heterostelium album PN500]|eukprot:XP_020427847.1 hypothetical protein PPL_10766 [Heterostelium album PN500]
MKKYIKDKEKEVMEIDKLEKELLGGSINTVGSAASLLAPPPSSSSKSKVRVIKKVIKRVPKSSISSQSSSSSSSSIPNNSHAHAHAHSHAHANSHSHVHQNIVNRTSTIHATSTSTTPYQQHNGKSEMSSGSTDVDSTVNSLDNEVVRRKKEEMRKMITDKVMIDKKTFETQSILIENIVSEQELKLSAMFLQPNHYDDIVVERALTKLCGYPTCNKQVQQRKSYKYYISTKDQKVYDQEELANYCSTECLTNSKLFRFTLDKTPVHLRKLDHTQLIVSQADKLATNIEQNLNIVENELASEAPVDRNFGNFNSDSPVSMSFTPPPPPATLPTIITTKVDTEESVTAELNNQFSMMQCDEDDSNVKQSNNSKSINIPVVESPLVVNDDKTIAEEFLSEEEGADEEDDSTGVYGDDNDSMPRSNYSDIDLDSNDSGREDAMDGMGGFLERGNSKQLPVSNYHQVYTPLSEWRTNNTEQYLRATHNDNDLFIRTDQSAHIKQTLHHYLSLYFPSVVNSLNIQESISSQSFSSLIDTFSLVRPIPSLTPNNWRMIILVLIKSLSYKHNILEKKLEEKSQIFERLLKDYGFDKYYLNKYMEFLNKHVEDVVGSEKKVSLVENFNHTSNATYFAYNLYGMDKDAWIRSIYMDLSITFLFFFALLMIWKSMIFFCYRQYRLYLFLPVLIYLFKCGCFITIIATDHHYYVANYLDQIGKAFNIAFILLLANGIWVYEYTNSRYLSRLIPPMTICSLLLIYNTTFLVFNIVEHSVFPPVMWTRLTGIMYTLPFFYFLYICVAVYRNDFYIRMFIGSLFAVYFLWWIVFSLSIFLVPRLQIFITSTGDVIIAFLIPMLMSELIN